MSRVIASYIGSLHSRQDVDVHCWIFTNDGKFMARSNNRPAERTHSSFFEGDEMKSAIVCGRVSPTEFTVGSCYSGGMTETKARRLLDLIAKKFPDAKMVYCGTPIIENCFADA